MQHLGLISLGTYHLSIIYILKFYGVKPKFTISDYVSSGKQRSLFIPATILTNTILITHIIFWLLPKYEAHWSAYLFISVAYLAQIAAAFMPRLKSSVYVHDALAVIAAFALLLMAASLYMESVIEGSLKSILLGVIVLMSGVGLTLISGDRAHYAYFQLAYHLLFSFFVIVAAYY